MAQKKRSYIQLPDEIGASFEEEDYILNYRPKIEYVEPPIEPAPIIAAPEAPQTIDDVRDRTQKLVEGLKAVAQLADLAQKRIDDRVEAAGGLNIKLDPDRDYHTIAAMKRKFPDKDPNIISYDDYKKALDCMKEKALPAPEITAKDIRDAKSNPLRTDFGGSNNLQGENRPEISSPMNALKPININDFQKNALLSLFKMLLPLILGKQQEDS